MDLSKVKEIITPAGSLKKILRNDVVIWSKKSDLVYTIWKDGVLIDRVTMPQFVNKIHNGDAQTDYGIGAQIIIPYTDPFDGNTYNCPFNFGTFTQYGEGKLGLQTHYALPSKNVAYRSAGNVDWENSYIKAWFNSSGICSVTEFSGKNGFLSCLPADFVETMQNTITGPHDTLCKVFLLTATQYCADTDDYDNGITGSGKIQAKCTYPEKEGQVWEYWQNIIGSKQIYKTKNDNRIIYLISTSSKAAVATLSRHTMQNNRAIYNYIYVFNNIDGEYMGSGGNTISPLHYQPACVIG